MGKETSSSGQLTISRLAKLKFVFSTLRHSNIKPCGSHVKAKTMEAKALANFTFKPQVTSSPKGVKVEGVFLDRVAADINARKSRDKSEKKDAECKFQPEISKSSQKIMKIKGAQKFEVRMKEDLEKRRDKADEIKKELAKPPKFDKKKK